MQSVTIFSLVIKKGLIISIFKWVRIVLSIDFFSNFEEHLDTHPVLLQKKITGDRNTILSMHLLIFSFITEFAYLYSRVYNKHLHPTYQNSRSHSACSFLKYFPFLKFSLFDSCFRKRLNFCSLQCFLLYVFSFQIFPKFERYNISYSILGAIQM